MPPNGPRRGGPGSPTAGQYPGGHDGARLRRDPADLRAPRRAVVTPRPDDPGRRTGPTASDPAAERRTRPPGVGPPGVPHRWRPRLDLVLLTPDKRVRSAVHAALAAKPSPVRTVRDATTLADLAALARAHPSFWLVDRRTESESTGPESVPGPRRPDRGAGARPSPRPPVLWLDVVGPEAGRRPTASALPGYLADTHLAWDEQLGAVPFRGAVGDAAFGARLRTRVALLPADLASERLYCRATAPPPDSAGVPVRDPCGRWNPMPDWRSPTPTATPPELVPIRRGTSPGDALLRLVFRPERYPQRMGHAVLPPDEPTPPRRDRERVRAERRRAFYRACAAAGFVPPATIGRIALLLRVTTLSSYLELGTSDVSRLLGFSETGGNDRPSRSTFHRALRPFFPRTPDDAPDVTVWNERDLDQLLASALRWRPGWTLRFG